MNTLVQAVCFGFRCPQLKPASAYPDTSDFAETEYQ